MSLVAKEDRELIRLRSHLAAVRENWKTVAYLKEALEKDDKFMFLDEWVALGHQVQVALWVAPSKGGIFTTSERTKIREWEASANAA